MANTLASAVALIVHFRCLANAGRGSQGACGRGRCGQEAAHRRTAKLESKRLNMFNAEALAFDDLRLGQKWTSESRIISQSDILKFANLTGDHTPIHVDPEHAAQTPFRQVIAHGLLGLSVLAGLSSEYPKMRTAALLDIKSWQFMKPILVGDQVTVETEVIDLAARGRRYGEVHWHRKLYNQAGEVVQQGILVTLVETRRAEKTAASVRRIDSATVSTVVEPHSLAAASVSLSESR